MDTRYKLVITIAYFALAVVAVIVVALIAVFRPDATATMIQFIGTVLGIASTGAVTFYMLGKQNEKIEQVKVQTNGNLSKVTAERDALQAQLLSVVSRTSAHILPTTQRDPSDPNQLTNVSEPVQTLGSPALAVYPQPSESPSGGRGGSSNLPGGTTPASQ